MTLYVILSKSDKKSELQKVVGEDNIVFEQYGVLSSDDVEVLIKKIAHGVVCSALIVDIDICEDGMHLARVLGDYRAIKDKTRVVVLAEGREPGDRVCSELVSNNIFDIISFNAKDEAYDLSCCLSDVLSGDCATWKDARKWKTAYEDNIKQTKKEIIYSDRIVGTIVIAVGGTDRGVGCTHIAISIGSYLMSKGHKVALLDMSEKAALHSIGDLKGAKILDDGVVDYDGAHYFNKSFKLNNVLGLDYKYVILDLGRLKYQNEKGSYDSYLYLEEMYRSDISLLVCGAAVWQLPSFDKYKDEIGGNWNIAYNFSGTEGERIDNVSYTFPVIPDPFELKDNIREFMSGILAPVLPKEKKAKKWLFGR